VAFVEPGRLDIRQHRLNEAGVAEQFRRNCGVRFQSKRTIVAFRRIRGNQLSQPRAERGWSAEDRLREASEVLGGSGGYWMGRIGGRSLLVRYGHLIHLDADRLLRTEKYFERHGMKTVFFARFIALLRIFGSILAGVAHMPFPTFSVVNMLGGVIWATTFSALGFVFGKNLPLLDDYIEEISIGVTVVLVVAGAVYWWRRRKTPTEPA